jgi:uncharacterized protein (UPF0333 family)
MKKLALPLAVVFAAGMAYAAEKPAHSSHKMSHAAVTHHDVAAEVVSVDAANRTLTLKMEKGEQTVPVEGKAVASLKNVKAGEKITVTCKDVGGEHKSVTAIKAGAPKAVKS